MKTTGQSFSGSNIPVNPTAQKLRFWVPSSLRLPAAGYYNVMRQERGIRLRPEAVFQKFLKSGH